MIIGEKHEEGIFIYTIIAAIPDGPDAWMVTSKKDSFILEFQVFRYYRTTAGETKFFKQGQPSFIQEIALIEMMLKAGYDL